MTKNERIIEITEELRSLLADCSNLMESLDPEEFDTDNKIWNLIEAAWEATTKEWVAAGGMDQPVVDEIPE